MIIDNSKIVHCLKSTTRPGVYFLCEDYENWVNGELTVIPAGFEFGPSIPKWAKILGFNLEDKNLILPSLKHDWAYYTHLSTKEDADKEFYTDCIENGFGGFRSSIVKLMVKYCGKTSWKHKEIDYIYFVSLLEKFILIRVDYRRILIPYKNTEIVGRSLARLSDKGYFIPNL